MRRFVKYFVALALVVGLSACESEVADEFGGNEVGVVVSGTVKSSGGADAYTYNTVKQSEWAAMPTGGTQFNNLSKVYGTEITVFRYSEKIEDLENFGEIDQKKLANGANGWVYIKFGANAEWPDVKGKIHVGVNFPGSEPVMFVFQVEECKGTTFPLFFPNLGKINQVRIGEFEVEVDVTYNVCVLGRDYKVFDCATATGKGPCIAVGFPVFEAILAEVVATLEEGEYYDGWDAYYTADDSPVADMNNVCGDIYIKPRIQVGWVVDKFEGDCASGRTNEHNNVYAANVTFQQLFLDGSLGAKEEVELIWGGTNSKVVNVGYVSAPDNLNGCGGNYKSDNYNGKEGLIITFTVGNYDLKAFTQVSGNKMQEFVLID